MCGAGSDLGYQRSFSVLGGRVRYYPSFMIGNRRFYWPIPPPGVETPGYNERSLRDGSSHSPL